MRVAGAVINPSLFEGWSTTVEEAKSMGVPMLLSDIGVHREQAEGRASFFDPHAPETLADLLVAFEPLPQADREALLGRAAVDAAHRVARFADDFCAVSEAASRAADARAACQRA